MSDPLVGLHHAALTVSNLDRSAEWSATVLGMVEDFRESFSARRAVVFRFPAGGMSVGLVERLGEPHPAFDPAVTGLDDLAFTVSTAEAMNEWALRLQAHGVEHNEPHQHFPAPGRGVSSCGDGRPSAGRDADRRLVR